MNNVNFNFLPELQDQIVILSVTDSEFLKSISKNFKLSWLPSVVAQDAVRTCFDYFDRCRASLNGQFPDELDSFLEGKPKEIKDEYWDYLSGVFEKEKPSRSSVLDSIRDTINACASKPISTVSAAGTREVTDDTGASITLKKFSAIPSEPLEWLWPNRFPNGAITMIGGEPDVGKSFLTVSIIARVTTGRPWPDVDCEICKGSAILVCCEDHLRRTVKPRLEAAGADLSKVETITNTRNSNGQRYWFNLKEHLGLLEKARKKDTRLIVIDPLGSFLGGCGLSTNTRTRAIMDPISEFAARCNLTILLITHLNKNVKASSLHRFLDSIGQVAAARSAWLICEDKARKDRRLMLPVKANLSKKRTGLAYWLVDDVVEFEPDVIEDPDLYMVSGATRSTPKLDAAKEWLTEILADGQVKSADILRMADEAGISEDTLRRAKDELGVERGHVGNNTNGYWYWILPQKEEDN
ncbi:AAA family ATPase [Planctomycetota bacterium]